MQILDQVIKVLMSILMIFLDMFMILLFLCGIIFSLCLMDYILDLDVKGWLTRHLGERKGLKRIRKNATEFIDNLDEKIKEKEVEEIPVNHIESKPAHIFPDNVSNYMSRSPSDYFKDNKNVKFYAGGKEYKESKNLVFFTPEETDAIVADIEKEK